MATHDCDPNTPAEGYAGKNIHFLPKSYLKQAGINGAAVLYGFAIKLKGHKSNFHEGRYWYYETAENLCERRSSLLSQLKDVVGKRESWDEVERLISELEELV